MSNNDRITPYHWVLFTICFLGTAFAGTISTLMSVYLPVAVRDLLGTQDDAALNRISAYISAIFIFGGAFGGFACGWISDRFGRKPAVIISIASYAIFTIATGHMQYWTGVLICRFFSGFGLGAVLVTTTTIIMEEWPAKSRAIFLGILSISIPIGIFSAGVTQYIFHSWREGFNVGYLPLVLSLVSVKLLRESRSWLENRSKPAVSGGPGDISASESIFSGNHGRDLLSGSVIFGSMLIGLWAIFSWIPTWIQTLITEGDGQQERGISMMMLGIGGLAGGFLSGWLMNGIGVRKSMVLCFTACTILSFILFKTNTVFSAVIYAEILVIALFFGASQGVLSVYIPQLFPVAIRGTATGFCFNAGRLVTATAVLFVGVLVTELGGYGNSLFVFSMVFLIGLFTLLFTTPKPAENGTY
ncbi:MFS transporter [Flavihumibacter petaseus]|uniref:Putative major facilitator superfamily transporter n=1 Tax=Flavihumibacter petaseus NBRC 106054 TaxID=1220578 RepID=A0A0E9MYH5_9BACT|nr:MFS transporter [Flavihumibacter petaseus]GAO42558.1 putative major facilitator superfamily transporter [Flavihumibacter petaseus NBRC 106054]